MKRRLLTILGTIFLSLMIVGIAYALALSNVDGVWGTVDTNGATCNRWATGDGAAASVISDFDPAIQTPPNADENQVRYGKKTSECNTTPFADQSGFGFDGNDNVGTAIPYQPFYLGEFTHYNNPVSSSNPFEYVSLSTNVSGILCENGLPPVEGSNLSFSYRFDLLETPNVEPCAYPGSTICPDRVTVSNNPAVTKFTCPEGEYTMQILGFVNAPGGNGSCINSSPPGPGNPVTASFITEEKQDNYACLWAQIIDYVPTAIDLASFTADAQINAIALGWTSANEIDILGYNIYRSSDPSDMGVQINSELVEAKNSGQLIGATYDFLDENARFGQTYIYTLQIVLVGGGVDWSSEQITTAALPFNVFVPVIVR